jgi:peptide/nickel transport system substrate-binding protein
MKKFCIFISLTFVLFLLSDSAMASDKNTFVKATYGTVRTLDPACAYDTTSGMRVRNIMETLVEFDGESTENYRPLLATKVPTVENGGISKDGKTYTFEIRKGVKFHNGATLTPEDVEYSLERSMIVDQEGGPSWMMLEVFTLDGRTRDNGKPIPGVFKKVMDSIEVKGNSVVLHLPRPFPPLMGIIQFTANSIINKKWAIEQGAWDGKLETAAKYNNPDFNTEPLQGVANGTGAYKLKSWERSNQFVFERFDGYWGPKATIQTAIVKYVPEWTTRKLMLQNGDVDTVTVDNTYYPEIKDMPGIRIYKVPQLAVSMAFMNQKINLTANPDVGSGKLDGNGIPADFFADINVRRAFQHALDYRAMKEDVANGLIENPRSPNVIGLPYYKKVPLPDFNLKKAAEYMKKAHGGKIWEKGFKMTITHNTGNTMREAGAFMLAENISSLNPKFQIDVRNVQWKDYVVKYRQGLYPIFAIGWGADYPDPHNFLYTFMHSNGPYGKHMGVAYDDVDKLCEEGIATADPKEREEVYHKLQDIWVERALAIGLYQMVLVKPYRNEVTGFVPNPMFSDAYELLRLLRKQ